MKKIILLFFLFPVFIFCQEYNTDGNINTYKVYDNSGKLERVQKYIYNGLILEKEKWFDGNGKLIAEYSYNSDEQVNEIIKYSKWSKQKEISEIEKFYYDKNNTLEFSLYFDNVKNITEVLYNSRGDIIHRISHGNTDKKEILNNRNLNKVSVYKKELFSNSVISSEGYYENNKKEGFWVYYYKNGETKKEGTYYMGEKNQIWYFYNENGDLIKESEWFDGQKNSETCWDINGKKINCK